MLTFPPDNPIVLLGGNAFTVVDGALMTGPLYADGRISRAPEEWCVVETFNDAAIEALMMLGEAPPDRVKLNDFLVSAGDQSQGLCDDLQEAVALADPVAALVLIDIQAKAMAVRYQLDLLRSARQASDSAAHEVAHSLGGVLDAMDDGSDEPVLVRARAALARAGRGGS